MTEPDLDTYSVTGDGSTSTEPITVLTCDTCSRGYTGQCDVHWWEDGSPTISDLIDEARRHETAGHRTREQP